MSIKGAFENINPLNEEYLVLRNYAGKFIQSLSEVNPNLKHSKGYTYLCRMPNGYLKIGTTKDLKGRMSRLKGELLYFLEGGETLELLAHYELRDFRIPVRGEYFFERPEVVQWFQLRQPVVCKPYEAAVQKCIKCGQVKPLKLFGTHRTSKSGYYRQCKACRFSSLPSAAIVPGIEM